jgi:La-related protein 7
MPQMEGPADQIAAGWFAAEPVAERPVGLPRTGSSSRLNAQAPAVVVPPPPQVIRMFAAPPPPPRAAFFAAPPPRPFEYYAPVGGRSGFAAKEQQAPEPEPEAEMLPPAAVKAEPVVDGLDDEVVHKITKQVGVVFPVHMFRPSRFENICRQSVIKLGFRRSLLLV